ncbi:hypothetical protein [Alkalihalobacillus sp. TS-13]|uniref:hypothetical protein n=1 Tax=Alkalihalobacillus sp. TS-13 TaxID=2842455 RepID=UPI001C88E12B|nr:hypothetical protein [Alkalihalobacillus sp. TS-13]
MISILETYAILFGNYFELKKGELMEALSVKENRLNELFKVNELEKDPPFRFVPMVYKPIGFDWMSEFEKEFTQRFNGIIRESEQVGAVHLAVFPSDEVLKKIHHGLRMFCRAI